MIRIAVRRLTLLGLTTSLVSIGAGQIDTQLRPNHRAIVEQWLMHRPDLRLANEGDCKNRSGLAAILKEKGRTYQPYYAVGDFNGDGEQDFASRSFTKRGTNGILQLLSLMVDLRKEPLLHSWMSN